MRQILLAVFFLIAAVCGHTDDDLLTDGQPEEVAMELDPDFQDDFDIGSVSGGENVSGTPGLVIADSYYLFSSRDLSRRDKSLSLLGGSETIASMHHFLVFPQGRFEFMKFYGHLGVPLRFPVYDNPGTGMRGFRSRGFVSGETFITPRRQDFRDFFDVQRVFRHMELNEEKEDYYFRLSRINALTMGQGELLRNLTPDGLYDHDVAFLTGHVNFQNGRVSGFIGPLFKTHMFGLAARMTPLATLDVHPMVRDLNFELAYMNDFMAPNQAKQQDGAYLLDSERRLVDRQTGTVQGFTLGVASEYFAQPWLSLKPYTSMGNLWLSGLKDGERDLNLRYGAGFHLGHDATVHFFPGTKKSVLVFKTEGRLFSKRYWPGYFGSTYLIDRNVINEPGNTSISAQPVTKSEYLGRMQDDYYRYGYLFELGYSYDKVISGVLGYENARSFLLNRQIDPMRKLHFMLSFLGLDVIKFHLGMQATALAEMKELFDFEKSRALLSLRGQLKLAPFLYFDAWAKHSFGINDMFTPTDADDDNAIWLSNQAETKSLNFGLGLEFAMTF